MNGHHLRLTQICHKFLEKLFITSSNDVGSPFLMIILLCLVHSLNESRRSSGLQKLERKLSNAVSLDVLLYHSCKFDDLLSTFLLFVLNLSR